MARLSASRCPAPPLLRSRSPSSRANLRKSSGRASAGTPAPPSWTSSCQLPASGSALRWTEACAGVWRTALSRRLSRTRRRRSGSAFTRPLSGAATSMRTAFRCASGRHRAAASASQHEQAIDQSRHAFDLLLHLEQDAPVLFGIPLSGESPVELGPHEGQRRAQLVGSVGREAAQALEAVVEAGEHAVKSRDQLAELVRRHDYVDPAVKVVLAYRSR